MKNNSGIKYSEISSFKDFRDERERLIFRSRIIESKLKLSYFKVTRAFSPSNMLSSLTREFLLPKISQLLGNLINKRGREKDSETD